MSGDSIATPTKKRKEKKERVSSLSRLPLHRCAASDRDSLALVYVLALV